MNEVFFIHDEVRRTASRIACPHPNMEEPLNKQPQYNAMENLVKKFSIEPRASDPLPMTKNVVVMGLNTALFKHVECGQQPQLS